MLWFFAFTSLGIAIFTFFLAVHKLRKLPLGKLIGGTVLLGLSGLLAARADSKL